MEIGIVGLKFSGKTTLFNAITGQQAPVGVGGVDPRRAVAPVPDPRLDSLAALFKPRKTTPASVGWVDVPGFSASGPEARSEAVRFLEHGRRVDALVQVVKAFPNGQGAVDPVREVEDLAAELVLADLQIVENRLERLAADRRKGAKTGQAQEASLLERFRSRLEAGLALRGLDVAPDELKLVAGFAFLSLKPRIVVLNVGEDGAEAAHLEAARSTGVEVVDLCARLEAEIGELPAAERAEFLAQLGIAEPALARTVRAAYRALGLHSFFTVGEDECRAWTVRQGALAPEAAGAIHSDLERGFIRAEVCGCDELLAAGGLAAAKRANLLRLEGKSYAVRDGDVLNIRFSV